MRLSKIPGVLYFFGQSISQTNSASATQRLHLQSFENSLGKNLFFYELKIFAKELSLIAKILLNAHQLIVLADTISTASATSLD